MSRIDVSNRLINAFQRLNVSSLIDLLLQVKEESGDLPIYLANTSPPEPLEMHQVRIRINILPEGANIGSKLYDAELDELAIAMGYSHEPLPDKLLEIG